MIIEGICIFIQHIFCLSGVIDYCWINNNLLLILGEGPWSTSLCSISADVPYKLAFGVLYCLSRLIM